MSPDVGFAVFMLSIAAVFISGMVLTFPRTGGSFLGRIGLRFKARQADDVALKLALLLEKDLFGWSHPATDNRRWLMHSAGYAIEVGSTMGWEYMDIKRRPDLYDQTHNYHNAPIMWGDWNPFERSNDKYKINRWVVWQAVERRRKVLGIKKTPRFTDDRLDALTEKL